MSELVSSPSGTAGSRQVVGFVGLGSMGGPLAGNLVEAGFTVHVFDAAGTTERAPAGAVVAASVVDVAESADVIVLSLPDGKALLSVVADVRRASNPPSLVLDTSTVGPAAAAAAAGELAAVGTSYCDAPVSGGVAGAKARTIAVLFSGPDAAYEQAEPVLRGMSDRHVRVGDRPGSGQVVKLANNFLSATALVAASEAVAFGEAMGVEMSVMLEAVNAASGRSQATADKFVNHVLTGRFASGFANVLMDKDVRLYRDALAERGMGSALGDLTGECWHRFATVDPGVDFTRIYPFVRDQQVAGGEVVDRAE